MVLVKLGSKVYHKCGNYSVEIPEDVDTKLFVGLPNGYITYTGNAIAIRLTSFGKYLTSPRPTRITAETILESLCLLIWYPNKFEVYNTNSEKYIYSSEEYIPESALRVWLFICFENINVGIAHYGPSARSFLISTSDRDVTIYEGASMYNILNINPNNPKIGEYSVLTSAYQSNICRYIFRGTDSWNVGEHNLRQQLISDISEDGVGQLIINYDGEERIYDRYDSRPLSTYTPIRYTSVKSARNC